MPNAQDILQLQEELYALDDQTFEDTIQSCLTLSSIKTVVRNIFIIAKFRENTFELYVDLVQALSMKSDGVRECIISQVRTPLHDSTTFPKESTSMALLYACYKRKIVSLSDIAKLVLTFYPENRIFMETLAWFYLYYAPEFEQVDKQFYDRLEKSFKKASLLPQFQFFRYLTKLDSLQQNQWERLKSKKDNMNQTKIQILKEDKVDELRILSTHPNFNVNHKIQPSAFYKSSFLQCYPTLLQVAAYYGSLNCFNFLLAIGADIAAIDTNRYSTMRFAIAGGNLEIIRICQQHQENQNGWLQSAVKFHRETIFNWLYDESQMQKRDSVGLTVLHAATHSNNLSGLLACINSGFDINVQSASGSTPLHSALRRGALDVVNFLATQPKIDLEKTNGREVSNIHTTARYGDLHSFDMFCSLGSFDLNAPSLDGQTPLHIAVTYGHSVFIKHLLTNPNIKRNLRDGTDHAPLHLAIPTGKETIIAELVKDKQVDINATLPGEGSPLAIAVVAKRAPIVKLIMERADCDPNLSGDSVAPIHHAILVESAKILRLLLNNPKVDPNAKCGDKERTPLHQAILKGNDELIKILLDHPNIDRNACDNEGSTILHAACQQENPKILKMILEMAKGDINTKDKEGKTPIFYTINKPGLMKLMLEQKKLNTKMKVNGNTLLHMVAMEGKEECCALLIDDHRFKLKSKNDSKKTAYELAYEYQNQKVFDLLDSMQTGGCGCLIF